MHRIVSWELAKKERSAHDRRCAPSLFANSQPCGLPFRPHEQTADEEYRQLLEDRREAEKMIAHGTLPSYPSGEAMVKDILS